MTVHYIDAITERYNRLGYDPYRWYHADSPPAFAKLDKPLSAVRLGMLGTSGAYALGQVAYHYKDDTSIRAIAKETPEEDLRFAHITENYLPGGAWRSQLHLPAQISTPGGSGRCDRRIGGRGSLLHGRGLFAAPGTRGDAARGAGQIRRAEDRRRALRADVTGLPSNRVFDCERTGRPRHPTIILGSARDITQAGRPPRMVFLDYPLGHSAGRPRRCGGAISSGDDGAQGARDYRTARGYYRSAQCVGRQRGLEGRGQGRLERRSTPTARRDPALSIPRRSLAGRGSMT